VGQDLPLDRRTAMALAKELYGTWQAPINALSKAGRAFAGLEALLGGARDGSNFDLQVRCGCVCARLCDTAAAAAAAQTVVLDLRICDYVVPSC
jgi:hypothetical protein